MIIGFDGSRAFSRNRTGTENYSYQVLKNLSYIDIHNTYKVYLRPGSEVNKDTWPSNFEFITIPYKRLWTQVGLGLQTFKDNLDILFVPSHTLPLIRKPGLKTVMTVHDLGAEFLPQTHQLKQRLYLGFITKVQLKMATKLIAVSQSTKNDLVKKVGVNPSRIEVIYEAVDKDFFKQVKGDALTNTLKQFDLKPNDYFLFAGTIQPRKNLYNLISGYDSYFGPFDQVPKLVLAGSKGWLSDEIYKLVKILGLEEKVIFTGRVSDEELRALYSGAIALTFPSKFEGFGLPILEAMSCNLPVITARNSSLPEVGGEAVVYVKDYLNGNSIAEGMMQFLIKTDHNNKDFSKLKSFKVNEEERQRWIKKGQFQLKKFSWEKTAKETLTLLHQVASA